MRRVRNCISAYVSQTAGAVIHQAEAQISVPDAVFFFWIFSVVRFEDVCVCVYDMVPKVGDVYAVNCSEVRRISDVLSEGDKRTRKPMRHVFIYVNAGCISLATRVTLLRMSPV